MPVAITPQVTTGDLFTMLDGPHSEAAREELTIRFARIEKEKTAADERAKLAEEKNKGTIGTSISSKGRLLFNGVHLTGKGGKDSARNSMSTGSSHAMVYVPTLPRRSYLHLARPSTATKNGKRSAKAGRMETTKRIDGSRNPTPALVKKRSSGEPTLIATRF